MKRILLLMAFAAVCAAATGEAAQKKDTAKLRIIVVDSYHREYLWSQHVHQGFSAGMLAFGYFDGQEQADELAKNDLVETSKVIVKKLWFDAKRRSTKAELTRITPVLSAAIREFRPDLIFLGDDDAVDYIGNQFVDTAIPVVFWGVNSSPVKYGLVESLDRPGHNVTGVYQTTYYAESLDLLRKLVPRVKTFAILSDDTSTGRIHAKSIQYLAKTGRISLSLVDTVITNNAETWKRRALDLQTRVDAFFIAQYSGLKDQAGRHVPDEETAAWYIANIGIPEAAGFRHRVMQGMLCAADDSGYNQGYEGVAVANDILVKKMNPAAYPPRFPRRGPLMVNAKRAASLGIALSKDMGIEEFIGAAGAGGAGRK